MRGVGREEDLLARFRRDGDARAMEELVAATRPRLVAIARRIGAPQDADDSVQAAYHALLRHAAGGASDELSGADGGTPLGSVQGSVHASALGSVTGWLVRAVVRIAYRRKAASRRDVALAARLARPHDGAAADDSADDSAARAEVRRIVRREVHRLPAKYRDAVILHHLEGVPVADAARLLDVPEGTVKTHVRRGRLLLRSRLEPSLVHGALFVPWVLADGVRVVAASADVAGGVVVKSKLAAAVAVAFAFGAGIGVGAVATHAVGGPGGAAERDVAAAPPSAGDSRAADRAPRQGTSAAARPESAGDRGVGARSGRAAAPDADAVRAIVRAEIEQMFAEAASALPESTRRAMLAGGSPPERGAAGASAPKLPAPVEGEARAAVAASLASMRKLLIERDIVYEFDAKAFPAQPDPARFERYPDERAWPKRVLGWIETDAAKYRPAGGDGAGFDGRASGAWVFAGPLTTKITAEGYASLVLLDGLAPSGVVSCLSYATLRSDGNVDGKVFFDSYATAFVRGGVSGSIDTKSYFNLLVEGPFSGALTADSSCNVYLLGGFSGRLVLGSGRSMVFIAGYTPRSALDGVSGKGGLIVLESSDLAPGEHRVGSCNVRVGSAR